MRRSPAGRKEKTRGARPASLRSERMHVCTRGTCSRHNFALVRLQNIFNECEEDEDPYFIPWCAGVFAVLRILHHVDAPTVILISAFSDCNA